jgi:alpha-galactosidase
VGRCYGEVEGARGDWSKCSWCKEHPDLVSAQFQVDLTRPEVAAHVEAQLLRLIERYNLDLYREDYNRPFTGELRLAVRDDLTENEVWHYYAT